MRVSKISIPTGSGYPFLIHCGFYPRIPMGTDIFDIPTLEQIIINAALFFLEDKNTHKYYTWVFNILFNVHK